MFYELFVRFFSAGIWLASFFHPKAKKWVAGRKNWREHYRSNFQKKGKTLWIHAASLGEFEQGRPVIEAFRQQFPGWQVVLTFFSPSGFEIRKNYPHADFIVYLPADTRRNAHDFLDLVQPDAAIFIKYEFWKNYLHALRERGVPTLLISAVFRENQLFFKWYGRFWRSMLSCFTHIFVQNEASEKLLRSIGFEKTTVAGDTRIDRVLQIAEAAPRHELIEKFVGDAPVFIVGSSWPADEVVFLPVLQKPDFQYFKIIIAPHEPSPANVRRLCEATGGTAFSNLKNNPSATRTLVIDNVGMLNTLYNYARVAFIGGGFGAGIHNTLEPAAYGLPVIFGPRFEKFEEARQLTRLGGAFSVKNSEELEAVLKKLNDPVFYKKTSETARGWLLENRGATERILKFLKENI